MGERVPPDRFLVGLATLTLFAEVAEEQPLVCVVEDAQWLDKASAQILGFVARRLLAERVALVGAVRTGIGDSILAGVPELRVGPLGEADARALLLENLIGPLDAAVCDEIVAESHGNPLALLEFPRSWGAAELAGGIRSAGRGSSRREDRRGLRAEARPAAVRYAASRLSPRPPSRSAIRSCSIRRQEPRDRHVGRRPRSGRRAAHGRSARRVRAPARPVLRLPLGGGAGPPPRPPRARRCHRHRNRPGPASVAPRPGHPRAQRGSGSRTRTVGRSGAGARRDGRSRRVPAAGGRAHGRSGATRRSARWPRPGGVPRRSVRHGAAAPRDSGGPPARRVPTGTSGSAPRPGRHRPGLRRDAPPLLLDAGETTRTVRPGARSGCLPGRLRFGVRCRASRATGRLPRDLPCRRRASLRAG